MKVFLSHPMHGLSEEKVTELRSKIKASLDDFIGEFEIIDNYHHKNVPENAGRLWHLGASIQMMEEADLIVFCPGYEEAKGCRIEKAICDKYNIPYITLYEYSNLD